GLSNTHLRALTKRAYGFHSPAALIAMALLTRSGLCSPLPGLRRMNRPMETSVDSYIFPGEVPGALAADIEGMRSPVGTAERMSHRMLAQERIEMPGGSVRVTDSTNVPAASTIAAAWLELQPGAIREMHWHPNNDEWQYWISGHARMTVFGSSGEAGTFNYFAGDVGYVPFATGHYFENVGDEPVRMLELFRSDHFADVSLNQWLAPTPAEVVAATLNLRRETIAAMRKNKPLIMP
ncbi:MAG TPA: cupin domain-containing protein, partial [Mycobacterium sp.]|nr:cupin domain-containing protein [Mycobacterium sp.]